MKRNCMFWFNYLSCIIRNRFYKSFNLNLFDRYIEPTILLDPPLDSEIMNEEIFGPILPIITVRIFSTIIQDYLLED